MRLFLVLCLVSGPAWADGTLPFQTPDGNIRCNIVFDSDRNHVRCDIAEGELSFADAPEDCAAGWGHAFEVPERGEGTPICAEDTEVDADVQRMEPGFSHGIGGVICFSEPEGMTCMNAEAHGFTLTRAEQTVF